MIVRRFSKCFFQLALLAGFLQVPTVYAQAVITGQDGWLFYGHDNMTEAGQAQIGQSVDLMKAASDALQAKGIGFVVLVAPMKARFYEDKLPAGVKMAPSVQDRYTRMIDAMGQAGLVAPNLTPMLKQVQQGEQTAFLQKDSHWTAWSAEAVAAETAKIIQSKWKLEGVAGSGQKLGAWTKERRFSDFAQLMTADQRKKVGPQIYVVRTGGDQSKGLLDTQEAPVHVVGNSFVQPYLGFTQALSADLDRPVGLTWKYGNFGPWSVFLEYLESPDFKQSQPQVILWQLNETQMLYGPDAAGQWDASSLMSAATWRDRIKNALVK
ncbi:alginate O-acetyltransferase AlgX-related protein [Castellaniella sp.]|uniref:alginate O-acetyltransferase AlgX-related protein n=1 Tax=Castellaniella sp. TaxID=1955812 RepID=UPI002AFFFA54|nr:twin-arginine translocation pathway signal [Castellaniella sp.]